VALDSLGPPCPVTRTRRHDAPLAPLTGSSRSARICRDPHRPCCRHRRRRHDDGSRHLEPATPDSAERDRCLKKKQPFGSRAKQNLGSLAFGKNVQVEWSKLDRYRRIVGKVIVDGQDVGLQQLQAGLAWWYRQYAREQSPQDQVAYSQAEEAARVARLGLWSNAQSIPPWEYRHKDVLRAGYRQ